MTKEQLEKIKKCPECKALFEATEFIVNKMREKLMEGKQKGKLGWNDPKNLHLFLNRVLGDLQYVSYINNNGEINPEKILDMINYLMFAYIMTNKEINIETEFESKYHC